MKTSMSRRSFALAAGSGIAALVGGCMQQKSEKEQDTEVTQDTATETPEEDSTVTSTTTEEKPEVEPRFQFFDMHADTIGPLAMADYRPYAEFNDKFSGDLANNDCQITLSRLAGMRWVQCFASWLPDDSPDISHHGWYRREADWFHEQVEQHSDLIVQARSFSQIQDILDSGKIAGILTVENAACLDDGIEVVDEFVDDGVLIAGITWNGINVLGSGNQSENGLTDLGRSYISALEERGIVVDVSHLNDTGFWELEAMATRPYIATHSDSRALCSHKRNLTDDMFRALTARGGIVGLNYEKTFVRDGGGDYDFDELFSHVEHWLDLGGEDNLAFGSDRDGSDIPAWIADCTDQVTLYDRFVERLGKDIARKIFFDNALAFFLEYERASK